MFTAPVYKGPCAELILNFPQNQITQLVPGLGKLKTISQEKATLMRRHEFGWESFWDSNAEFSCLKLTVE